MLEILYIRRALGSRAIQVISGIAMLFLTTDAAGNGTIIGRWCDRALPNLPEYNRTMTIIVENEGRSKQCPGESRLEEALAEIASLKDQLAIVKRRLTEANETLRLRHGVLANGAANTPNVVDKSLYEAAETRVMQLAVENTRLRDQLAKHGAVDRAKSTNRALISGGIALRSNFNDGSSSLHVLRELRGNVYAKIGSRTGDKYRIVPSTGDLQLLDNDGLIRVASRLENFPQANECR